MSSQSRSIREPFESRDLSLKPVRIAKESANLNISTEIGDKKVNLFDNINLKEDKTLRGNLKPTAAEVFARPEQPRYENMDP